MLTSRTTDTSATRRTLSRSITAHVIAGGLQTGAFAFVLPAIILPLVALDLGCPVFFIAFAPALPAIGALLWGKSIADWQQSPVRGFHRMALSASVYCIAGLVLVASQTFAPFLYGSLIVAAPVAAGMAALHPATWCALLSSGVRDNRRSLLLGLPLLFAAAVGMCAGGLIRIVMQQWPGLQGWGVLHLVCGGALAAAGLVGAEMCAKIPAPSNDYAGSAPPRFRFLDTLAEAPPGFGALVAVRILLAGFLCLIPFITIETLDRLHKEVWYAGYLMTVLMAGTAVGAFAMRSMHTRASSGTALYVTRFALIVVAGGVLFNHSEVIALALFFVMGVALAADSIAVTITSIDLCKDQRQATCWRMLDLLANLGLPAAAAGFAIVRASFTSIVPLVSCAVIMLVAAMIFVHRLNHAAPLPE
jgi:hypothetical protein